jgi:quercetin dioxygenase-like cupin family protein
VLSPFRQPHTVAPGEGPTFWILDLPGHAKATAEQTGGGFSLVEAVCPPGYASSLHIHYLEDEAAYVLEGRMTFFIGRQQVKAVAGSYVYLPRGIAHGFRVPGDAPARMLCFSIPACASLACPPGTAPSSPLGPGVGHIETLADLAARYKIDVLGPLPDCAEEHDDG